MYDNLAIQSKFYWEVEILCNETLGTFLFGYFFFSAFVTNVACQSVGDKCDLKREGIGLRRCITNIHLLFTTYNVNIKEKTHHNISIREGLRKKIRNYLGIFPKCRTPPPHPPLLGTPRPKKNFMVYFAF